MENNPTAPAEAPKAPESVETPTTNTETTAAPQAPDMHGFTSEQLADMKKFFDNNGGFDAIKSKISNPQPAQTPEAPKTEPTSQPQAPVEPQYKTPEGAITAQEFMAKQYFQSLANEEKYKSISEGIRNGDFLKEMTAFGISTMNPDGSINNQKIRMYLDLKAQTVPAQPTGAEPNMSNAPTVEYYQVEGDKITTYDQAYAIIQQDAQLKSLGQAGHPLNSQAEEFIKNKGNVANKA